MRLGKDADGSCRRAARVCGGIALSLSMAMAGAAGDPSAYKVLEQRLRVLEDQTAIEKLIISDYAKTLDLNDPAARAALFTEDGELSSEWIDMAALPEPLRALFSQDGASASRDKLRPRITFKGRAAIANSMEMILKDRPRVSAAGDVAVVTFTYSPPPAGQATKEAAPDKRSALPSLMQDRYLSAKHLITNPSIQLDGDNATAISYWIEVTVGKDGKRSIPDGGYYSDVLKRVNGVWRFKQRVVHSYDIALGPPSEGSGTGSQPLR